MYTFGSYITRIRQHNYINGKGTSKNFSDKKWCDSTIATYQHLWGEIKEILWSKVMGIHSIIGNTSKKMELEYEKRKKKTVTTPLTSLRRICKPKSIL